MPVGGFSDFKGPEAAVDAVRVGSEAHIGSWLPDLRTQARLADVVSFIERRGLPKA